ncbi:MAG: class I SAM-dependent methyltransferase [Candidatus Dormibacterales bacterium]
MRYTDAVAAAPAGSARFDAADIGRLSRGTLALALMPGPASPPLEDLARGLGQDPGLLRRAALATPARAERLMRLAARPWAEEDRAAARERLVRGLFWWLVYELEPDLWLRLADQEPVHPGVLDALPWRGALVVEVAAGGGRLTAPILERGPRALLAVEPCPALRTRLQARLGGRAWVVAGTGHQLPLKSGAADLVVSCATFGPHFPLGGDPVLAEMERCVRPGGSLALVGPEEPAWFAARGFQATCFDTSTLPSRARDPLLADFFGPRLTPPHDLLVKRL